MNPWRVRMVYAVVALVVLGHLHEIVRQQEHWPFLNYPMWARLATRWEASIYEVVGLTDEPAPREVDLTDPAYCAPLSVYFQRQFFNRVGARRPEVRDAVLGGYLDRYESRRRQGLHAGPPLGGLRIYRTDWTMDRQASTVSSPHRRAVVHEYRPQRRGGAVAATRAAFPGDGGGGDRQ